MAELAMLADIQWMVYPEEVTRQLHVMAQDRKSSPVIGRRSNHCATPPTFIAPRQTVPLSWPLIECSAVCHVTLIHVLNAIRSTTGVMLMKALVIVFRDNQHLKLISSSI